MLRRSGVGVLAEWVCGVRHLHTGVVVYEGQLVGGNDDYADDVEEDPSVALLRKNVGVPLYWSSFVFVVVWMGGGGCGMEKKDVIEVGVGGDVNFVVCGCSVFGEVIRVGVSGVGLGVWVV